jgi:hypothetical protein
MMIAFEGGTGVTRSATSSGDSMIVGFAPFSPLSPLSPLDLMTIVEMKIEYLSTRPMR